MTNISVCVMFKYGRQVIFNKLINPMINMRKNLSYIVQTAFSAVGASLILAKIVFMSDTID
ncbi:hypothetical protein ACFL2U_02245 [Patescibacteria group bacterium]